MKSKLSTLINQGNSMRDKALQDRETDHLVAVLDSKFILEYKTWIRSVHESIAEEDLLDTDLFDEHLTNLFDINTPALAISTINGELIGTFNNSSKIDEFIKTVSKQVKFLQKIKNVEPISYDFQVHTINFMGKKIQISKNADADPIRLLNVIFQDPAKTWPNDEILDIWYGESREAIDWEKAVKAKSTYHAGRKINDQVQKETSISDLLEVTTKTIKINPKYL
jgi:hypothetical protein